MLEQHMFGYLDNEASSVLLTLSIKEANYSYKIIHTPISHVIARQT